MREIGNNDDNHFSIDEQEEEEEEEKTTTTSKEKRKQAIEEQYRSKKKNNCDTFLYIVSLTLTKLIQLSFNFIIGSSTSILSTKVIKSVLPFLKLFPNS